MTAFLSFMLNFFNIFTLILFLYFTIKVKLLLANEAKEIRFVGLIPINQVIQNGNSRGGVDNVHNWVIVS